MRILVGLVAIAGCARHPVSYAVDAYANALRAGDYATAYALMSTSYRERISEREYVASLKAARPDVEYTVRGLQARDSMTIAADVTYGLGDTMRLVEEGGKWRIASDPLLFYDRSTPRATLRSFVRAYELRRWQEMLAFVPSDYRKSMTAKTVEQQFTQPGTVEMMARFKEAIDGSIEQNDLAARVRYGTDGSYEIRLLLEAGEWVILDLQ